MHQISPKAKMRSRFMILCQLSLNNFPFIFPPPLLYKLLISFISKHDTKSPSLPLFWVLVKLSSLVKKTKILSETHFSSPNSFFPPPLRPPSRVSSSAIWILHEGIIHFPNLIFLCCHDENLGLKHDSNYLNSLEYVWMFLNVFMCSSYILGCSSHIHA